MERQKITQTNKGNKHGDLILKNLLKTIIFCSPVIILFKYKHWNVLLPNVGIVWTAYWVGNSLRRTNDTIISECYLDLNNPLPIKPDNTLIESPKINDYVVEVQIISPKVIQPLPRLNKEVTISAPKEYF